MKDVIYEMSRKGLGITTVQDGDGRLLGVITDGDLRRLMEADPDPLARSAAEVMHTGGRDDRARDARDRRPAPARDPPDHVAHRHRP